MATTTHIKFGDGLAVTDEGAGIIRVDGSGGGAPSGPAGGVLSGTYPNPGFAADMATQAELDTGLNSKVSRDAVEAATSRLVAVKLAVGDAQPSFRIMGDGKHEWGPGGATAPDIALTRAFYSGSLVRLRSSNGLEALGDIVAQAGGTYTLIGAAVVNMNGDTTLYRAGPAQLHTESSLRVDATGVGRGLEFGSTGDSYIYRSGGQTLASNSVLELGRDIGAAGYTPLKLQTSGGGYEFVRAGPPGSGPGGTGRALWVAT